jgi:hypothetical protein
MPSILSNRPLLYDVFCGAGGATRGYQLAGFRVVGVDSVPQKHYVGDDFLQMDYMDFFQCLSPGKF